jgi:hypothetical protein
VDPHRGVRVRRAEDRRHAGWPRRRPDACTSFSAQLDTCQLPNPFPLMLAGTLIFDTNLGVLKDSNGIETPVVSVPVMTLGAEVRALVATSVVLMPNTILRAEGVRGFAIVAREAITIQANTIIDVSQGGAGHRGDCGAAAAVKGMDDNDGGAGGGGGGLGATGGDGGNGDADMGQSTGGAGGAAAAAVPPGPLGGCPGASGGRDPNSGNDGGAGGRGGGAVYLVSAATIGIAAGAGIYAGGGGGGGGTRISGSGDAGGGGGGSGGSIFLEAPAIRSGGILAANGGGGGGGGGVIHISSPDAQLGDQVSPAPP